MTATYVCICGGCGWVPVDTDYVHRHAAAAISNAGGHAPPGMNAALENSVMPCYECEPERYRLWADGHYRPGHSCPTCRPGGKR